MEGVEEEVGVLVKMKKKKKKSNGRRKRKRKESNNGATIMWSQCASQFALRSPSVALPFILCFFLKKPNFCLLIFKELSKIIKIGNWC